MEHQIQHGPGFSPVALIALLVSAYLTWSLPRRFAICPLFALTCLMPLGQELEFFGLHLHLFRVLLLVGVCRCFAKGEAARLKWTKPDKIFVWWVVVTVVLGSLSKPSVELFVNRAGDAYNAAGCYFFIRCVIVEFEDIITCIRTLAWLCIPVAALMLVERQTGHNPFAVFGGVPEISAMRDGKVRCQGAFRHAILAGTFGAAQIPLFTALWFYRRSLRPLLIPATIAALIIVFAACSSGALMALFGGMAGLALWKIRTKMRLVRWAIVAMFLVLMMMMKAPVWYVFAKVSDITGGGGWHRGYLIDQAVSHLNEWWLFGTTYTAHWGPAGETIGEDPNMMDITNHFVMEGIKGGLLKLTLFVVMIVIAFKIIGRWVREEGPDSGRGLVVWAMGAVLFAHCLSFMSVPYFDQIIVIWFWLLAVIFRVATLPVTEEETAMVAGESDADQSIPEFQSSM